MSYNKIYTIDYKRLSNKPTHIEILQNGWTGGTTVLKPDATPLTINLQGDSSNIFCKTIGTGVILNVIANPLSLITLFNNSDPQANIVKIYNSTGATNLFWQGFINPVYQEDYSVNYPTPVSINCGDGMQLLDTIYYKNSDYSFYTLNTSVGNVIKNVLSKLNLSFGNVYSDIDLTTFDPDTDTYKSNLFKYVNVNQHNYIDESFVPMTCRGVLDSLFGGIDGLKVQFIASDLYIINPINLNDATKGKKYTLPDFTESTSNFGGYVDIMTGTTGGSSSIGYYQTGQNLGSTDQVNEINIKYNPYNQTGFNYDFNAMATGGTFSHVSVPSVDYWHNMSVLFSGWTQTTSGGTAASGHFIGLKQTPLDSSPVYGLLIDNSGDVLTYKISFSNINPDLNLRLKITLESYCQTRLYLNGSTPVDNENIYGSTETMPVFGYKIITSIKCGNLYFDITDSNWKSSFHNNTFLVIQDGVTISQYSADGTKSIVNDTWVTTSNVIPIGGITGGSLTFSVNCIAGDSEINRSVKRPEYDAMSHFRRILIKSVKIDITDIAGNVITNNGILTRGNISTNLMYKTNVTDISTTSGCGNYGVSRGSYFTTSNQPLLLYGLYRTENGSTKMTDKLLIQTFQSQYKVPRVKLMASLNVKNYGLSLQNKLIKNTKYLGKAFYISSYSYVDDQESMDVEAVELASTYDSI